MAENILTISKDQRRATDRIRRQFLFFYTEHFFNKWMGKYRFNPLNDQQYHFIMKQFWALGTIAASPLGIKTKLEDVKEYLDFQENKLIFTPWTTNGIFNIYDYPTKARLINKRGVKFITTEELEVNKEVVIGFAQKNHKSVFSAIEAKLHELIDIEMKIRASRKGQTQGWLFGFDNEDIEQVKTLKEAMDNDEPYMFGLFKNLNAVKGLASGAPFIVDKLEAERIQIYHEILTILGIDNLGVPEKKEHLVTDEIESNNQEIASCEQLYQEEINSFFERIKKCFGVTITLEDLNAVKEPQEENTEEDENNDN